MNDPRPIILFLSGDVMTGRGVDQALPHSVVPRLYESHVKDARRYLALAEEANGPIVTPVDFAYVWGDALDELHRTAPDLGIVNLETGVTSSEEPWGEEKGIHYRMHPDNVRCLTTAGIGCCVLANNHVQDWGRGGLIETLETLHTAGIRTAGAGRDLREAAAPAVLEVAGNRGRVLVFGFGTPSAGIPRSWGAGREHPGVNLLEDLSARNTRRAVREIREARRPGDLVVASIHWGGNWGYEIPAEHRRFAHRLIEEAEVDVVHGHSSHHPKGIEIHRDRPILYGCGELLNDYEGIGGYEEFRGELVLMYLVSLDPAGGRLLGLEMGPMRIRRLRLERASAEEAAWLAERLDRESRPLGARVELRSDGRLALRREAVP